MVGNSEENAKKKTNFVLGGHFEEKHALTKTSYMCIKNEIKQVDMLFGFTVF